VAAGSNTAARAAVGGNRALVAGQHHMEATCYRDPHREVLDGET